MFWTVLGFTAATLTMFSFIPQIVKMARTKSSHDVSLAMLVQLSLGVILWIAYGIHLHNPVIIIANTVTLVTLVVLICLFFLYCRPGRA